VRVETVYGWVGRFGLLVASVAAGFAVVGLLTFETASAGASAACATLFFIPGLVFALQAKRLRLRDLALKHVATFMEARGVVDMETVSGELSVPRTDSERIVRRAIAEGYAQGEIDRKGRFVARSAARCPQCGTPLPTGAGPRCVACGLEREA